MPLRIPRLPTLALAFLGGGCTLSIVGAALPSLARSIGATEAATSLMATWFSVGAAAAAIVMIAIGRRVPLERILSPALAVVAAALAAIPTVTDLWALYGFAALAGAGFIGAECVVIALIGRRADAARGHGVVNSVFALGAVLMPVGVALAVQRTSVPDAAYWAAASIVGVAGIVSLTLRPTKPRHDSPRFSSGYAVLATVICVYVGAEATMATWLASLAEQRQIVDSRWSALSSSLFWGALLVGRVVATTTVARTSPQRMLLAALIASGSLVGVAAALLETRPPIAVAALAAGVVAAGPVFQLVVTLMGETRGLEAVVALLVLGSVGSIAGTAVAAWVSDLGGGAVLVVPTTLLFVGAGIVGARLFAKRPAAHATE